MCCVEDAGGGAPSPTKRCLSRSKDSVCVERDVSFASDIVMDINVQCRKAFNFALYPPVSLIGYVTLPSSEIQ